MRWEDERYVRVYTRDTGDWLALSFEAQALFLMLLRKVDRIGELPLGRRGLPAVPALVGHAERADVLNGALQELLSDGCVRVSGSGDVLFIPNFLKAQETAKSPTERKREQRERDAAKALENTQMSRDVTPVTNGHEMSPRAVPCRAVPSVPPVPDLTGAAVASPAEPVSAFGGMPVQQVLDGALPEKRGDDSPMRKRAPKQEKPPPHPRFQPLKEKLVAAIEAHAKAKYGWQPGDARAIVKIIGFGPDEEALRRLGNGLRAIGYAHTSTISQLASKWNEPEVATGIVQPKRAGNARFFAAQDSAQTAFDKVGAVNDF